MVLMKRKSGYLLKPAETVGLCKYGVPAAFTQENRLRQCTRIAAVCLFRCGGVPLRRRLPAGTVPLRMPPGAVAPGVFYAQG